MLKLALNLMIAGNAQLIAEALVLGEANGLDRAKMLEVMGASAAGSPFVKYKSAALVQDDYTATFTGYAMWKDLTMALAAAHDASAPLPVTATIQQLFEGCIGSGWGGRPDGAAARFGARLEPGCLALSWAGVEPASAARPAADDDPRRARPSPRFVKWWAPWSRTDRSPDRGWWSKRP